MDFFIPAVLLIALLTLYLFSYSLLRSSSPPLGTPPHGYLQLQNKSILLLISHPDDEAMFFAPTLLALSHPSLNNDIRVICLSDGNAWGIGHIRRKEVVESCRILGVFDCRGEKGQGGGKGKANAKEQLRVKVIDRPELQDNMKIWWDEKAISGVLEEKEGGGKSGGQAVREVGDVDVLITFDGLGISGHRNHISARRGARRYLFERRQRALLNRDGEQQQPVLYTLTTVNVYRKYLSYLDLIFTTLFSTFDDDDAYHQGKERGEGNTVNADPLKRWPRRLIFQSNLTGFKRARRAMMEAHKTQMRWFRYGWIFTSRYMVLNELVREGVDVEVDLGCGGDKDDIGSDKLGKGEKKGL